MYIINYCQKTIIKIDNLLQIIIKLWRRRRSYSKSKNFKLSIKSLTKSKIYFSSEKYINT